MTYGVAACGGRDRWEREREREVGPTSRVVKNRWCGEGRVLINDEHRTDGGRRSEVLNIALPGLSDRRHLVLRHCIKDFKSNQLAFSVQMPNFPNIFNTYSILTGTDALPKPRLGSNRIQSIVPGLNVPNLKVMITG